MELLYQKNNVKMATYCLLMVVIDACFHVKMFAQSVEMVSVTNVKLAGLYSMESANQSVGMEL